MRFAAILRFLLTPIGALSMGVAWGKAEDELSALSLIELEQRVQAIDTELDQLASFSMRSGAGAIGFRSNAHLDSGHTEWVRIELGQKQIIDQIVLVPAIVRDSSNGFQADGFPIEFRILAGTEAAEEEGHVIAGFSADDQLTPRIAPLVIPLPEAVAANWIKVEATRLSSRAWDGMAILQLSEIMAFSGQENVALEGRVEASSGGADLQGARRPRFLVDGFVPYLMDAAQGEKSLAFVSNVATADQASLVIDLETNQRLNRIHMHSTELGDNVPQSDSTGFGVPRHLIVEGSNHSDFSNAVALFEYRHDSIHDVGPIIMRRFPETNSRYVRLTAIEPSADSGIETPSLQIGFAEIEVFSAGVNVALGKEARGNLVATSTERRFSALTDGRNIFGKILTVKEWMNQLARRHDLEGERPLIIEELDKRYARQKVNLTRMGWLVGLLTVGLILTLLISRILRLRQAAYLRERLAADLHDDLGASLHTIGLLSDLAAESKDSPEDLASLHQRIRSETERTGIALRHCTDRLNGKADRTPLVADMKRASQRIMANLEHEFSVEGEAYLELIEDATSFDLLLFYQECLVNAMRHSGATQFITQLKADQNQIHLVVCDNGSGLQGKMGEEIPSSLKRRARHLGAKISVETPATGGTCIHLRLTTPKKWLRLQP